MFGFEARRGRAARAALVMVQVFLLLFSSVGSTVVLAADPTPSDAPAAESPTPDPSPTEEPAAEPSPTEAPTPDPTTAPDFTPDPTAAPDPTPAPTDAPAATPTIASDKADYAPGELVTLTGAGWQSGENVHIYVNDHLGSTWSRNVDVTADATGAIHDQFNLPNWFVASYTVVASGSVSGQVTTSFTDADNTTTTVTSSLNPSNSGQSVTFTATVKLDNGTAVTTGQVKFGTGANCAGGFSQLQAAQNLSASGQVTFTTSSLVVGTTVIRACYIGTGGGGTQDSFDVVSQVVNTVAVATKIALGGATTTLTSGTTRVLTATVQDAAGNTVTTDNTTVITFAQTSGAGSVSGLGTATVTNGVATKTVTGVLAGSVTIAATSGSLAQGTGNPVTFSVVAGVATKIALAGSTANLTSGTTRVLTATVQDAAGNTVTTDNTTVITFAQTTGAGSVSGLAGGVTVTNGVASKTVTGVLAGSVTIAATSGSLAKGTGNPVTFSVVHAGADHITLTGSTADLVSGTTRQLTATIRDLNENVVDSGPDSTLLVAFAKTNLGGGTVSGLGSASAVAGVATATVTGVTVGFVTVTASSGTVDTDELSFTVVHGGADHITVTGFTDPTVVGAPGTFEVEILDLNDNTVTSYSGSVTFSSSDPLATLPGDYTFVAGDAGVHVFSATLRTVGEQTITATDSADPSITGSQSAITVNKADTTTALTSSVNPSVFGQSVTFTATVSVTSPGAGSPTGSITFRDGTTVLAVVALVAGQATFSTTALSVGGHSITAEYSGDPSFNTSTSDPLTQTVNKADTTTAVASSVNPSVFGQSVTFTATVSPVAPGAGLPTGTVQFTIDGTDVGSPVSLVAGQATLSTASLGVGNHTVTATYSGDGNFNTSNGTLSGGQTVNKADTTTALTSSVNPSVFGQSVTFTATVSVTSPGAGSPTGTVQFAIDGTDVGSPVSLAAGQATLSTASLGVGNHTVTATYSGDGNFNGSTSATLTQTVNKANTTTGVTSSVNPSILGQSVTFTASVSPVAPGAGIPTGTVQFKVDGTSLGSPVALAAGQASISTSSLSVGNRVITAEYIGDGSFNGSTGTLSGGQQVSFLWSGFLQPINDTAHQTGVLQSKFKLGQTIPAKFVLRNFAGQVVTQATSPTFSRSANRGTCDQTVTTEPPLEVAPDSGVIYKWDGTQYHFNWSTKGLQSGEYRIYANLADGTQPYVDICLTK